MAPVARHRCDPATPRGGQVKRFVATDGLTEADQSPAHCDTDAGADPKRLSSAPHASSFR